MTPTHVAYSVWPVLVVLLYLLVTNAIRVLADHQRYAIRVHDLVLDSKLKRRTYAEAMAEKDEAAKA